MGGEEGIGMGGGTYIITSKARGSKGDSGLLVYLPCVFPYLTSPPQALPSKTLRLRGFFHLGDGEKIY